MYNNNNIYHSVKWSEDFFFNVFYIDIKVLNIISHGFPKFEVMHNHIQKLYQSCFGCGLKKKLQLLPVLFWIMFFQFF